MIQRHDLLQYFSRLLTPENFQDYCPNGLQVEGKSAIKTLVTGVTACQALLEQAVVQGADAILVHHGYFWNGEAPTIVGMKQRRLKILLQHDINLFAYHLPLDAHPEVGNNVQLAQQLGLTIIPQTLQTLLWLGVTAMPMTVASFSHHLTQVLSRPPLHVAGSQALIHKVAWCTGAAQDEIEAAKLLGADAFISGEISERTVHAARELEIHYFAAGHHATERYGVQALGAHVAQRFGLTHTFIDIDNVV